MRLIVGSIFQGRSDYAREKYGRDKSIYRDLFEDLKKGIAVEDILLKANEVDIVVAEEPFGGLLPLDEETRELYENYGRILEQIASEAISVERVVCGLAQSLK